MSLGRETNRTVGGDNELVPKGRLQEVLREQLAHAFERLHGLGNRFAGQSIHEIGMDEQARPTKGRADAGGLIQRDALLHLGEQPVRGGLQAGRHGDPAGGGQEAAKIRREGLFETNVAPP